jgi:hypothetical protein
MANLLADGIGWLAEQLQYNAGTTVTYKRSLSSVSITATKARPIRSLDTDQAHIEASEQDWIVTAADLVLDSTTILPARGDIIQVSTTEKYRVLGDSATPAYAPHDEYGVMLRIHSKRDL